MTYLLLLLLLSCFSPIQLCATPQTAAHHAPLSLGFSKARILEWVAISFSNACMHAKSLQLCPTLCDPMDSNSPGSSVHRILYARILKWIAFPFSSGPRFVRNIRDSFILAGNYKTFAPWKKSYDQPRQHIRKQRCYFTNKSPSSQSYGFSGSHVQM